MIWPQIGISTGALSPIYELAVETGEATFRMAQDVVDTKLTDHIKIGAPRKFFNRSLII